MKPTISPLLIWPCAIVDTLYELGRSRFWLNINHQAHTQAPLSVDDNFFGINIATSEAPQVDDYVIKCLQDLGIQHVRLYYSYDSINQHGQRLLERVLTEGFTVMLNLLPSFEQAQQMEKSAEACQRWHDFVKNTLAKYHDCIAVLEIGNTPNRGKWSGFEPAGFLQAWKIAAPIAQQYDIKIAGPNVSDFEPLYNILFLKAMKRLHSAPHIHTDNLFVERVIEPEAYDHRAMGRLLTKTLKLNLIKKARIIDQIGRQQGCEQTFSTYKMWTIKRLARRSADPEQIQANFLARYMVLAIASGALNRVYWGPLICHRDGIIDCGDTSYPSIDNTSYYKSVRGNLADFRKRPGFAAFKNIIQLLTNSQYVQGISADNGISHYIFVTAEEQELHITWARNGHTLPLSAIYSEQPRPQSYLTVTGDELTEQPQNISESPLFLLFATTKDIVRPSLAAINVMPPLQAMNTAIAALPHNNISPIYTPDWRGVVSIKPSSTLAATQTELLPEAIADTPEQGVMRDKRNRIWNIDTTCHGRVTVKLNRTEGGKRISYRFLDSKGKRHWQNATAMLQRGISTPEPIAYFERHTNSGVENNYYLAAFIENAFSARQIFSSSNANEETCQGANTEELLKALAQFICRMHNSGILHCDLSAGNILITVTDNNIQSYLIDIGRARVIDQLSTRQRLIDAMRICYKLNWQNRERFINYYNELSTQGELKHWRLAVRYYEFKQGFKKTIKAKLKGKKKPR
ncbi:MAG: hypothetical protein ACI90U_002377 [Pseudomonadales bacterium]|jgi:hypothetical protein